MGPFRGTNALPAIHPPHVPHGRLDLVSQQKLVSIAVRRICSSSSSSSSSRNQFSFLQPATQPSSQPANQPHTALRPTAARPPSQGGGVVLSYQKGGLTGGVGAFSALRPWENVKFVLPLGKKTTGAFLSLCARGPFSAFFAAKYLVSYV